MGQDELSENANMMIRNTINEVETMIERIKKDRTDNVRISCIYCICSL